MLAFRSEAHVDRWCGDRGVTKGAVLSRDELLALGVLWYSARDKPMWSRRSPEETEELFRQIGLTGAFWRLS
jgi:hypothetical protein